MHVHNPKLDTGWMFDPKHGTGFDSDGGMRRMWHENSSEARQGLLALPSFGDDPEKGMWEEMRDMCCECVGLFEGWWKACEVGWEFVGRVFG
jgi:hypothetical protein